MEGRPGRPLFSLSRFCPAKSEKFATSLEPLIHYLRTWKKVLWRESVAMWTVWTLWSQVNQALTSMAAMFVVAGGIRWRERRSALRAGPSGPSTAVVGSPQETYQELVDKSEFLGTSACLQ